MSRTLRIYNKIVKKAHRYYLDCGKFMSGFVYHPYKVLCMIHKDPNLDQKHQRKIRKREFMRALDMEME